MIQFYYIKRKNKIMNKILEYKSLYKYMFIIYYLLTKFHFFNYNFHFIDNIFIIFILTFFAGIIFIKEFYENFKVNKNVSNELILGFSFIFIYSLSTLINSNRIPLVSISYLFIFFTIFLYNSKSYYSKENTLKELKNICLIVSTMISVPVTLSIFIAIFETISGNTILNYSSFFQETRLIGVIGYYQNPNQVGITAFIGLITSLIIYAKFNKNILFIFFLISNFILVLYSDSRSVLLSLIFSIIIFIIYLLKMKIIDKKIILFIVGVSCISLLTFSVYRSTKSENRNIFMQINKLEKSINTENILNIITNQRYSLYSEAISIGSKAPIIGYGANSFVKKSIETYGKSSIASKFTSEDTHNIFVSTFFYTGIIGLLIILNLFFKITKKCYQALKISNEVYIFLIISCVLGIFIYSNLDLNVLFRTQFNAVIFWYFSGYILNYNHLDK